MLLGQKFLHIWMFHDILKFSYFGTPMVGKKFRGHFWRNVKVPPPKFLTGQKKILAKKFQHQIWTNVKVPPSEIFGWPKKNFGPKIPTPDLDKCKSTPPPMEVTPDLDTTHPGGQFCQRNLPCVLLEVGQNGCQRFRRPKIE